VVVSCRDVPDAIPSDVSLCVYRVAQEALSNVVKHSEVKEAQLELAGESGDLVLRVVDAGRGFEPSEAGRGLGLLSMKERLRLVGGSLVVRSRSSQGTEISAQVPMQKDSAKPRAATAGS